MKSIVVVGYYGIPIPDIVVVVVVATCMTFFLMIGGTTAQQQQAYNCHDVVPNFTSLELWTSNLRQEAMKDMNMFTTDSSIIVNGSLSSLTTNCTPSSSSTTRPSPSRTKKKKILLIGIDGLRSDAAAMLPLPNLRRLERMGMSSYWATVQTSGTAVSGPGWVSMLTGVESTKHRVDGNTDFFDLNVPTIFATVKELYPHYTIGASCTWHPLITNLIDYENSTTLSNYYLAPNDEAMTAKAIEWLLKVNGARMDDDDDDPPPLDFVFVHFDEIDKIGHTYGFDGYGQEYLTKVIETDRLIGTLLDAIFVHSESDDIINDEWLILVSTDHGGKGTSHGSTNLENRRIPLLVASNSPRVEMGRRAPPNDPGSHMDIPPTILHFLMDGDNTLLSLYNTSNYYDGQVFGFRDYVRVPSSSSTFAITGIEEPTQCISDPIHCGCGDQSDYRGIIRITQTGKDCQDWESQFPHQHSRTDIVYPDSGLEKNYCRNPDGERFAWCYTVDPTSRWEFCNVPVCDETSNGTTTPTPTDNGETEEDPDEEEEDLQNSTSLSATNESDSGDGSPIPTNPPESDSSGSPSFSLWRENSKTIIGPVILMGLWFFSFGG